MGTAVLEPLRVILSQVNLEHQDTEHAVSIVEDLMHIPGLTDDDIARIRAELLTLDHQRPARLEDIEHLLRLMVAVRFHMVARLDLHHLQQIAVGADILLECKNAFPVRIAVQPVRTLWSSHRTRTACEV